MNKDLETARPLIAAAELSELRLVKASFKTSVHSVAEIGDAPRIFVNYKANVVGDIEEDGFQIQVRYGVYAAAEEDEKNPPVEIHALFEASYDTTSLDALPSRKMAVAFARTNGVHNTWPFLREFVQSASNRMKLPPIVVPFFRL